MYNEWFLHLSKGGRHSMMAKYFYFSSCTDPLFHEDIKW